MSFRNIRGDRNHCELQLTCQTILLDLGELTSQLVNFLDYFNTKLPHT